MDPIIYAWKYLADDLKARCEKGEPIRAIWPILPDIKPITHEGVVPQNTTEPHIVFEKRYGCIVGYYKNRAVQV